VGAQAAPAQRLQFFLSESSWDAAGVNRRRLDTLCAQDGLRPHAEGVLIVDDSGDRKAGSRTAHVGRQYLGSIGKVDNGIVAVTTVWADERVYYPLHYAPYTPASRLPRGTADPAFRTKPQLAAALLDQAMGAAVPFRWESPEAPGDWTAVQRRFRDGHHETWWAADLTLGGGGRTDANDWWS
jgi:SRSO17 transposase